MNIDIKQKSTNEIESIKPLWDQLNAIHYKKSIFFKDKYVNLTFKNRIQAIYKKSEKGILKFEVLVDNDTGKYVGYCLSSIEAGIGEIDSIFVETKYRKLKLGDKLMSSALKWFEENSIINIQISVAYGNDDALPFYERYGFHIGNYILKKNLIK